MLKKTILKDELLTIKKDILQTRFIDMMYPISLTSLFLTFEITIVLYNNNDVLFMGLFHEKKPI